MKIYVDFENQEVYTQDTLCDALDSDNFHDFEEDNFEEYIEDMEEYEEDEDEELTFDALPDDVKEEAEMEMFDDYIYENFKIFDR